jgi:hypothetical protein
LLAAMILPASKILHRFGADAKFYKIDGIGHVYPPGSLFSLE